MSPACRRQTILVRLNKLQRAALETHLHDGKASTEAVRKSTQLCEADSKSATGIYRSTRTGGFYAKVFLYNLGLQGHVRKELADVINDHIGLVKVAEQLRRAYFESGFGERTPPSALQANLVPGLVASVQVFFYNRHFIGHRHLQLNFKTLTEGLNAWEEMQKARGSALFSGNGVTDAYTPEAARRQWQRIKETYLQLARGRHLRRSPAQLEKQLLAWEREHLPTRTQRDHKLWQNNKRPTFRSMPSAETGAGGSLTTPSSSVFAGDSLLLRCVDRLLKQQNRVTYTPQAGEVQQLTRKRMRHEAFP